MDENQNQATGQVTPPPPSSGQQGGYQPPASGGGDSNTMVILGYVIPLLFFLNMNGPSRYHANQQLVLLIFGAVVFVAQMVLAFIPILGWLVMLALVILNIYLWIVGIMHGVKGEMKPLPLIGGFTILK